MGRDLSLLSREQIHSRLNLPSGKLLLAFSGGSDSLCLLYLLSMFAKDRTEAVYINHKIRSDFELEREIALNRENASRLGIKLSIITLEDDSVDSLSRSKEIGVEAAARELRYRELEGFRKNKGFDYILTAHHREDQCETVLMRILQNSPFYTYRGILKKDGHIFRPLIDFSKEEILSVLEQSGLSWSNDSTNSDNNYLRNSIRHNIVPHLSEEAKNLIIKISDNVACYRGNEEGFSFDNSFYACFGREQYLALPQHKKEELIYALFSAFEVSGRVSRGLIRELDGKIEKGTGRFSIESMDFFFSKSEIRAYRAIGSYLKRYDDELSKIGPFIISHEDYDDKDLRIDMSELVAPIIIRTSLEGDRIALKGGSKKVSDIERELHIPYSIVLEDRKGVVAFFSRFIGGKDRLAERLVGKEGKTVRIMV